jgi:hypothetical protein
MQASSLLFELALLFEDKAKSLSFSSGMNDLKYIRGQSYFAFVQLARGYDIRIVDDIHAYFSLSPEHVLMLGGCEAFETFLINKFQEIVDAGTTSISFGDLDNEIDDCVRDLGLPSSEIDNFPSYVEEEVYQVVQDGQDDQYGHIDQDDPWGINQWL